MTLNPHTPDMDHEELRVLALLAHRWHHHGAVGATTPTENALLTRLRRVEAERAAADTTSPAALRTALIESVPPVADPAELAAAVANWFDAGPWATHPPTGEPIACDCDDVAGLVQALNQASGLAVVALWKTYDEDDDIPFDDFLGLHIQDTNGRLFSMSPAWMVPVHTEYHKDGLTALAARADPRAWIGELTEHTTQDCFEREDVNYALEKFSYY
ncbi:hypothetical protein ACIGO9_29805 [Nocardia asteroides]|uniref:hypothetical protein n=1 Tax=Nocardia asteroides TaxID=1824 RepID=UPI0037C8B91B